MFYSMGFPKGARQFLFLSLLMRPALLQPYTHKYGAAIAVEWSEERTKKRENCHQKLITIKSGGEKKQPKGKLSRRNASKTRKAKKYVECPTMGTNMNTSRGTPGKNEIK
jgi:hypothetical protein